MPSAAKFPFISTSIARRQCPSTCSARRSGRCSRNRSRAQSPIPAGDLLAAVPACSLGRALWPRTGRPVGFVDLLAALTAKRLWSDEAEGPVGYGDIGIPGHGKRAGVSAWIEGEAPVVMAEAGAAAQAGCAQGCGRRVCWRSPAHAARAWTRQERGSSTAAAVTKTAQQDHVALVQCRPVSDLHRVLSRSPPKTLNLFSCSQSLIRLISTP